MRTKIHLIEDDNFKPNTYEVSEIKNEDYRYFYFKIFLQTEGFTDKGCTDYKIMLTFDFTEEPLAYVEHWRADVNEYVCKFVQPVYNEYGCVTRYETLKAFYSKNPTTPDRKLRAVNSFIKNLVKRQLENSPVYLTGECIIEI